MQDRDVTAQIWGITYTQIWAKKRVTQILRNFPKHIARNYESATESLWQSSFFFQIILQR